MKRKDILSTLFLAAAMMAMNTGAVSAQSTGGSQSDRSGGDTQTPLPPKSPSSGSEGDASKTGKMPSAQSKPTGKAKDDKSVGGSQSERSGTEYFKLHCRRKAHPQDQATRVRWKDSYNPGEIYRQNERRQLRRRKPKRAFRNRHPNSTSPQKPVFRIG